MKLFRAAMVLAVLAAAASQARAQTMPAASPSVVGGFGRAVAISHDEVLVGEPNIVRFGNEFVENKSGFVYVYRKVGGKWTETGKITATDAKMADGFGTSISLDGDLMVVGSTRSDDNRGVLYVFQRDARGTWTQRARIAAPDTTTLVNFGAAVAVSGDVIVASAPLHTKQTGIVYVFRRTANTWKHEASLHSPEPKEQTLFGASVAMFGGSILVGEVGYNERTGTVHAFAREGNEWKAQPTVVPNGLQKNDRYGSPIYVDGNRILVGAAGFASNAGGVFALMPGATGGFWRETARYAAHDGRASDGFGSAIAAEGTNVWIGAPRANGLRGAVYRFWQSEADSLVTGAERVSPGTLNAVDFYGSAIAVKGNVAVVSISNADVGAGAVAVFENAGGKWSLSDILRSASTRLASITGKKAECNNNRAAGFECNGVELLSYVSVGDMGGGRSTLANDIWGWTDPETGKEWALVGRTDGTSFVDISNPEKPVYVANLPFTKGANPNIWRDIKVYKNHAYVVADGSGAHGMQVFDLTRLRNVRQPPVTFEPDFVYHGIASSHNIVINEETGYAYAVGASSGGESCGGGLHMIDIREPKKPAFAGCFSDPQTGRSNTGYSHDAQCVVYKGPDEQYKGREICLGSNETMLSIADVTDKKNPKAIARASYPNVGYSHQGWLDEEHRYFYMDDELDELTGLTAKTRTIVWDLTDLDDPQVATMYMSPTSASDHNLYIKGDTMYQSHYKAGLRIVDIKDRANPVEVGYFDTVPYAANVPGFAGSWSNYPYFKSGVIIVTSMNEGLFVLKKRDPSPVF